MNQAKISIVLPVYNEEQVLPKLFERLLPVMEDMHRDYEIILVDDGSKDRSLELLRSHASDKVIIVELSRNYGQHAAVFAGFEMCTGDIVVTLDADLQNPPEEIPRLVEVLEKGNYEVVGTVRKMRQDSAFRKTASRIVNDLARRITGVRLNDWGCMLRAYRRHIVDYMLASQEHSAFIPALATSFARDITEIEVGHEERLAGQSKYSLLKLISLYFDLVTSFSVFPLKFLLYSGFFLSFLGVGFCACLAIARYAFRAEWAEQAQGAPILFAGLLCFIGAQFLAFGVMGEYVGRIYREVRKRPPYTVRRIYR